MPTNADVFRKYPNGVFVETGSHVGNGIQAALDAGFARVLSVEISPELLARCAARFQGDDRVRLFEGDSSAMLWEMIREVDESITFWLDGHWSGGETGKGEKTSPLLEELRAIAQHPIKTHTILIDDMRCWLEEYEDIRFGKNDLVAAIHGINPAYTFSSEDGTNGIEVFPDDILVATIPTSTVEES